MPPSIAKRHHHPICKTGSEDEGCFIENFNKENDACSHRHQLLRPHPAASHPQTWETRQPTLPTETTVSKIHKTMSSRTQILNMEQNKITSRAAKGAASLLTNISLTSGFFGPAHVNFGRGQVTLWWHHPGPALNCSPELH
jgi:hypothetical protein